MFELVFGIILPICIVASFTYGKKKLKMWVESIVIETTRKNV